MDDKINPNASKLAKIDDKTRAKTLPDELIFDEILARLPIASLCRFKTVSKNWHSVISSPKFAKTRSKLSPKMLLLYSDTGDYESSLFLLSYDERAGNVATLAELRSDDDRYYFIVGSSNGLLCLYFLQIEMYSIWNPCTHEYEQIRPRREVVDSGDFPVAFGFGYASSIDDYRLLAVYPCGFYLFSSNLWTWKKLDGVEFDEHYRLLIDAFADNVCIDGVLYMSFGKGANSVGMVGIIAFDLAGETMRKVAGVDWLTGYAKVDRLFTIDGCLSLCCSKKEDRVYDVWMRERVEASGWRRLYSVPRLYSVRTSVDVRVMGFFDSGEYLVRHLNRFKVVDPEQGSILQDGVSVLTATPHLSTNWQFIESLVSFRHHK
ncbi:hypothetical protein vseg_021433 [Gypsophila vaccaria]